MSIYDTGEMRTCPLRHRDHGPRTCDGCGKALRGQKRRWCSDDCSDAWWGNHSWSFARPLTIKLAGGSNAPCAKCGKPTGWAGEVNHITPREGRGYGPGCHHHQDGLELLCHDCHVAETTRQIRARRGIPEGGRPLTVEAREADTLPLWEAS